ncbi:hypothetical protein K1719_010434 [Acacia pycnantha]|nr:hypothetical protein K1719_010434 [Acacia pycnantha]
MGVLIKASGPVSILDIRSKKSNATVVPIVIVMLSCPFNIMYRSSRLFFLTCLFHCICGPLYKVLNVLLRFAWLQTVSDFKVNFMRRQAMISIIASLEIICRGIWNFFSKDKVIQRLPYFSRVNWSLILCLHQESTALADYVHKGGLSLFLGFMCNPLSWVMEAAAIMAIKLANGGVYCSTILLQFLGLSLRVYYENLRMKQSCFELEVTLLV